MGILSFFLLNKCAYQFPWTDMGGPCLTDSGEVSRRFKYELLFLSGQTLVKALYSRVLYWKSCDLEIVGRWVYLRT